MYASNEAQRNDIRPLAQESFYYYSTIHNQESNFKIRGLEVISRTKNKAPNERNQVYNQTPKHKIEI